MVEAFLTLSFLYQYHYVSGGKSGTMVRMGVRRNFSRVGQSRHFAYLFQVVDDATHLLSFERVLLLSTASPPRYRGRC